MDGAGVESARCDDDRAPIARTLEARSLDKSGTGERVTRLSGPRQYRLIYVRVGTGESDLCSAALDGTGFEQLTSGATTTPSPPSRPTDVSSSSSPTHTRQRCL